MLKNKQLNEALNYEGEHLCKQPPKEVTYFSLESFSSGVLQGLLEVKVDIVQSNSVEKTCSKRIPVYLTSGVDSTRVRFIFTSRNL